MASFSLTFLGLSNPKPALIYLYHLCIVGSIQNYLFAWSEPDLQERNVPSQTIPPLNSAEQMVFCHFLLLRNTIFRALKEADICRQWEITQKFN